MRQEVTLQLKTRSEWGEKLEWSVIGVREELYELQDVAMEMEMEKWCNQGVG